MNSGNSGAGSTQSDGDEDIIESNYSKGGESISSFFNTSSNFATNTQFLTHQNTTFFDPQSNDNNDLLWSTGLRSETTTYGNFSTASSAQPSSSTQLVPPPPTADSDGRASKAPLASDQFSGVIKNPKKRSRVSNRAPTTVLTTDATNFRQMVQQFTGIPATPFSGSHNYSQSLDLFSGAALRPAGSQYLDTPGGLFYPLQPSISSSSSALLNPTMIDSVVPTANIVTTTATSDVGASISNNSSSNYPSSLPSHHPQFNIQNQSIVKDNDSLQKQ